MDETENELNKQFAELFSPASLLEKFNEKFQHSLSKGTDRLNGPQYLQRAAADLKTASAKCVAGTYQFSPYLENLRLKGRGKIPRVIGIPTIRDRILLNQLNIVLARAFPECVPTNIASTYVGALAHKLSAKPLKSTYVCGCDIKEFYDSIDRERLMRQIRTRIKDENILRLIKNAITTAIVPKYTYRKDYKKYLSEHGVPQGLAISNILASIYIHDIDAAMTAMDVIYYRYVDDIIICGSRAKVLEARKSLLSRLRRRHLKTHPLRSKRYPNSKSYFSRLDRHFGYLGYYFKLPKITVRDSSIERLLQAIANKFSEYKHDKKRMLERRAYLTEERLKEIFLMELNEKITGAISENKRYGWIAYYGQINDQDLLHKLDHVVQKLFERMADFEYEAPKGLRRFARAYFEMRFRPRSGYVRDYDSIQTRAEKLEFLVQRGRVGPDEPLTEQEINLRFDAYRRRVLAQMHADEGTIY